SRAARKGNADRVHRPRPRSWPSIGALAHRYAGRRTPPALLDCRRSMRPNVEGNRPAASMATEVQGMNRRLRLTVGLGHDFDVFDLARWRRNRKAIFTQTFQVKFDGLSNLRLSFCDGRACRHATRKIGNVSRVVVLCFLD